MGVYLIPSFHRFYTHLQFQKTPGGHREKANVKAQGGAGGAHGSVMIKY
jgi:hypothetical protein